ncbi:MAG: type I restriction endonuclease subunit R [Krumholzibacteria bacterium]|nr:type I restriction endonuclease subunit R [Candidatus Krumholzibacteria bacterium]
MSDTGKTTTERAFESAIEAWLLEHAGYAKAPNTQFDADLGLDRATLLAFIKATQDETWAKLIASYGAGVDEAVVNRIAAECDKRGLLDAVRSGVKDRGQLIRLAYFRPPTSLNPEAEALYAQNRLTVMRQVIYDPDRRNSIDMLLSLNGLPIATVELKNAFTGQRSVNAILQYMKNRVPTDKTKLIQYKKRALVHFAVDTDEAYMATRLAGDATHFLPFNTGDHGGKGNPADHAYATGYKTGYLWEQVWARDSWLDIIHRFIHMQTEETRDPATGKKSVKETLIFPRYHQLTATRRMLAATRAVGVGRNYLIQHSAGSGKTNTISWTAHQLASLHDDHNQPIYNTVVVVSDRRNLDRQLQDNIFQMEHKQGVVAKIDEDKTSADLADELNKGTKIIITTLQKFSFLLGKVKDLSDKRFAVIVDEAHSSQSGRSAGHLRGVLGGGTGVSEEDLLAEAEKLQAAEPEPLDMEELILAEAKSRGPQPNLSFYAFTATPKAKTLELFGVMGEDVKPSPFHLYSMRQAIEEGFILDVLKFYTTYKTYYKLAKAIEDDPEIDEKKAKKAIARFMSLHPHNIAQKTEIMVEHFRKTTSKKIGGRAKAMVVTRSRLHAVRYKQAFDKYIAQHHYNDLRTLVAFSGTVDDPDLPSTSYTEPGMNSMSEKELPARFASPEFHVLIVAEKYQTGFDQPLLHTMFVDKPLSGLKSVQTLSRLNRKTSGKEDTFVLDFANEAEEIKEGFKPYFERTEIEEPTDHNHVYELERRLRQSPVLQAADIDEFAAVYFKPQKDQKKQDHGLLNRWIDPAVERYRQEYRDPLAPAGVETYTAEGEEFKGLLKSFVRFYGFLSQIIDWQDVGLEKLYAYGRYLLTKLPYREGSGGLDLDDEVALASYRTEKTFDGSTALVPGEVGFVYGAQGVGTGAAREKFAPLSAIIEVINERFGTDWTPEDRLLFEQISGDMVADETLASQARENSRAQFKEVFEPEVLKAFVSRKGRNEKIVNDFMSNAEMRAVIIGALLEDVYRQARGDRL